MTDTCWICLDASAPLERNPPPCTCVSGGWVHRQCMRDYVASHPRPRLCFITDEWAIAVTVPHVCGVQMRAGTRKIGSHAAFLHATVGAVSLMALDPPHAELLTLAALAVLLAGMQAPLTTALAVAVAIMVPLTKIRPP